MIAITASMALRSFAAAVILGFFLSAVWTAKDKIFYKQDKIWGRKHDGSNMECVKFNVAVVLSNALDSVIFLLFALTLTLAAYALADGVIGVYMPIGALLGFFVGKGAIRVAFKAFGGRDGH